MMLGMLGLKSAEEYLEDGHKERKKGKFKNALDAYNNAINLDPNEQDYGELYKARAILKHFDLKDYDGAIADYTKAIQFDNDDGDLFLI